MQAFPERAKEIWDIEKSEEALGDDYEQIAPENIGEFFSLEKILSGFSQTTNAKEMIEE
jgi:antirestriction protein